MGVPGAVRGVGLAIAGLALAACGFQSGQQVTASDQPRPAVTTSPSISLNRVCSSVKPLPYPGPPPTLSFEASDHPGNEWVLPVTAGRVTVRFTVVQRADTQVSRIRFVIAPEKGPYPGSEVRRLPLVGHDWAPGTHQVIMSWDGRDDAGHMVAPGLYHAYADAQTTSSEHVTCADGSSGIERLTGNEGAGLGLLRVTR
jgi:hypothetical protein